jgi:DNA-binding transcriptional LysR family regulator
MTVVELRQLRYFVAVAEELHFTRAAERLGISQPPLSQQIQKLEAELGVELFARTRRRVALTEPGRVLLEGARRTLAEAELALRDIRRAARGEVGTLTLGAVGSAWYALLPPLLRGYRERYPDVELVLRQLSTAQQVERLLSGTLDAGLLRPPIDVRTPRGHPAAANEPSIATETIVREPLLAALPENHRLASRESIDLAELAGEPFIIFPRRYGPGGYDQIMALCRAAGFTPTIAQEAIEMHHITGLVAAGLGVALITASGRALRPAAIAYRPLAGITATWDLALAWRSDDRTPVLARFLDFARDSVGLAQ